MKRLNALAAFALLLAGAASVRAANTPGGLETPPSGITLPPIDLLQSAPTAQRTERPREPTGNPLWAIPLSSLSATRDRPLFSPSRRPPAPPAVVAAPQAAAPAKAAPTQPQRPPLTLVVGDNGGIAVFQSEATNEVVRLKIGDTNSGWTLRSVKGREATLQNDRLTVTLTLPTPSLAASNPPPGAPRPAGSPQLDPAKKLPPGWSVTPTGEIVNTE